jgi:inorganic pyrophosphatase
VPALYGFIPRTYCGPRVGARVGRGVRGDGDPLDICVFSERPITRAEILIRSRVVGGLQMVDHGEADDKIVAVVANDHVFGDVRRLDELPAALIERLEHYFLAYKARPRRQSPTRVRRVYGRHHALAVIRAAMRDYRELFGG